MTTPLPITAPSVPSTPKLDINELLATLGYRQETLKRIQNARAKATRSRRRAWHVGRNPRTHGTVYMVLSERSHERYRVTAYDNRKWGGYCYSMGGDPVAWITCTCPAFIDHDQPCWHCAKLQFRLEREA